MKRYYVYMVFCTDGTYYVGVTNNLERRLNEHNFGLDPDCYTFSRRPVVLAFSQEYGEILQAIAAEKKLKGWSHAKKRALARGDWAMVQALSKSPDYRPSVRRPRSFGDPSTGSG
jgi:putative endonuclease